jgi:leader peptidase (prepilin peptidase)/N-methyltransferase
MPMLIVIALSILGLALGSFVNALVWRLHEQKKGKKGLSILHGRSVCPNCKHKLAWYDLIPVISWFTLKGKCRYCNKPISRQYPMVEIISGIVFAGSYIFWPETVNANGQWILLATWLACSVGLLALAVYDLKWMLLPNKIIYPTLLTALAGRLLYVLFFESKPGHAVLLWALSILVASGVFYALYVISNGKWIGFGDVRLGLITGTLLADPQKAIAMIFIASLIGTVLILPSLIKGNKNLASRLPYGPFLIVATAIMVVFGDSLLNWYKGLIL